jgi:hypothetical protein
MGKKTKEEIKIQNAMEAGIGPYELTRIEKRKKKNKKDKIVEELAARKVDTDKKKVTDYYVKDGKKYKLEEELGAVQRRGVDLSQKDQEKLKLLGVKQSAKGGMIKGYKHGGSVKAGRLAKRGYGAAKK